MKEKIVYSILVVFFFLSVSPLSAQESSPTDDIVVKATGIIIFQMTANLKLTQDQISAVTPIISDNIAKNRNLQQNLEDGTIDSEAMYSQREKLINDEDQELGSILTPDQMKMWINMQNQSTNHGKRTNSK